MILKPSPDNVEELYLKSLEELGVDPLQHDIRFVEDNWEAPTLGAWGLGWEIWLDGMEITQFTYFQQVGGFDCNPISGELTYGLERLAMYVQGVDHFQQLVWNEPGTSRSKTYADIYLAAEQQFSAYNFNYADTGILVRHFTDAEIECAALVEVDLPLPAYDQCIKASHIFNLLEARGMISVTERAAYIGRVRDLAKACAKAYLAAEGELVEEMA